MKRSIITTLCGAAAGLALLAGSVRAEQQFGFQFNMPVQVNCKIDETGCDNSPGPQITIEGEILLGGLRADLVFQNNLKGTHTNMVTYSTNVALVLPGGSISIPKQPVKGGVGGNPWIWIQFIDEEENCLSEEILLGRCVQGLTLSRDLINAVAAATTVTSGECSNRRGPVITMGGQITLSGMKARLIFRNNVKGTHPAEQKVDVALIINGTPVQIPKQPSRGGAGGNPLIWLQFEQGNCFPIGDPIFLGRCNQI